MQGYSFNKLLEDRAHNEPKVHAKSREETIVAAHHAESLFQRRPMVLIGSAAIQIVRHHTIHLLQLQAFALHLDNSN
jgi:hypothetical protein